MFPIRRLWEIYVELKNYGKDMQNNAPFIDTEEPKQIEEYHKLL